MTFPIVLISRLRFSNVLATHNNLVTFFFSFSLTCRLRGIESRPNERGDKALCNNVLSIWTRREEFSLSCTLRVSRYVTILLIGELLCFFFFFCEKIMQGNVCEIHYKLISKVVLCIFYLELNLLFMFLNMLDRC